MKKQSFVPLLFFAAVFLTALVVHLAKKSSLINFPSSVFLPPRYSLRDITKRSNQTILVSVGDIMLGRYCNVQMLKNKDWKYPFSKTASFVSGANIAFGNLEAPIIESCSSTETGMIFCARPESIEGLKFAGFDILSIANNHILNQGQMGREQTANFLKEAGILASENELVVKKVNHLLFGFLSFDLVTYPNTPLVETIKENSKRVDVLIISLHWGAEYQKEPAVFQKELARQIIDAGAKIIIGHHPHVTQPTEKYNNGLIFYSLGNFVFDQPWSEETKKGEIARIIFEEKEIKSYELIPIYIENFCQPKLLK